jgi:signal transduction histidine kinase
MCQQFQERTGIAVRVVARDAEAAWAAVSENIEICLYRVAQESLTNVAKHSGATRVEVQLSAPSDGVLTMHIRDNGSGWQRERRRSPSAFGLKGMTERVRAVGGTLRVEDALGGGCVVAIEIGPQQSGAVS